MHEIEPYYNWRHIYVASEDPNSPFYEKVNNEIYYEDAIYGYVIHPQWDYIGSETLYVKILMVNYDLGYAILEFIGEWNDTLHNDIMHLKRNVLDLLIHDGIGKFILIGENVFNFHGSDDCYYEEWFDELEDGWIFCLGFRDFVRSEWSNYNVDSYLDFEIEDEFSNWRTYANPNLLFKKIDQFISYRLE